MHRLAMTVEPSGRRIRGSLSFATDLSKFALIGVWRAATGVAARSLAGPNSPGQAVQTPVGAFPSACFCIFPTGWSSELMRTRELSGMPGRHLDATRRVGKNDLFSCPMRGRHRLRPIPAPRQGFPSEGGQDALRRRLETPVQTDRLRNRGVDPRAGEGVRARHLARKSNETRALSDGRKARRSSARVTERSCWERSRNLFRPLDFRCGYGQSAADWEWPQGLRPRTTTQPALATRSAYIRLTTCVRFSRTLASYPCVNDGVSAPSGNAKPRRRSPGHDPRLGR